jgi:hypothetical protein
MVSDKNIVRFLAFSCVHAPFHDQDAVDWMCGQIEEFQPDVVVDLGDSIEAEAGSRWPSEAKHGLIDELRADNDIKAQIIRSAQPGTRFVKLMGNHEMNLLDENRLPPDIRELCDWRVPQFSRSGEQINRHALQWELVSTYDFCRKRGVFRIGQVTFGHGWYTDGRADEKHAVQLGCPFGLFVGGHTHSPSSVSQAMLTRKVPLDYWYANAGTLRDLDPQYMKRSSAFNWGHACVVGEADLRAGPAKSLRMSRRWDAETRVKEMYRDWSDRLFEPVGANL